jgi:hypothetical protein
MRLTVLAVALVAALAGAASALADADPASDMLLTSDVFIPFSQPPGAAAGALKAAVDLAYAHGYRLKVGVVAAATDLGGVPNFLDQPGAYAKFLGTELRSLYVGPLLIVMRAGFGIYDGGRSTAAEERVLAELTVNGSSVDELIGSATTAVQRLVAAGALKSRDITRPYVAVRPTSGRRGRIVKLPYYLGDDSKRSSGTIRIRAAGKIVGVVAIPLRPVRLGQVYFASWRVPRQAPKLLEFCLVGVDPAGNRSLKACGDLTVR